VIHMVTYLKCGDTQEETVALVKAVAECVMTNLYESVGEGDNLYYPFEEAFQVQVSPRILTLLETDVFVKLHDIGIEIGKTKSLDELCMDYFICDAVFYCFGLPQDLLLVPKEQWPKADLAYGWKRHQNYIIPYPLYNYFLFMITYSSAPCYSLSNDYLFYIFEFQIYQLSSMVK
jgi:hypothetical protein